MRNARPLLAFALAMLPAAAIAQTVPDSGQKEHHLTLYAGYRGGGKLTDDNTGQRWEATDGTAYALSAGIGLTRTTQLELFVSHRNSALKASGFSPAADNLGLDITYYHAGGTYFPADVGQGWYLAGGLGATHFQPQDRGLNPETRLSMSLAAGYMVPLGRNFGIKLEARGYGTLIKGGGAMFCSGGCVVQLSGDTMTQAEVLAGLSARF